MSSDVQAKSASVRSIILIVAVGFLIFQGLHLVLRIYTKDKMAAVGFLENQSYPDYWNSSRLYLLITFGFPRSRRE